MRYILILLVIFVIGCELQEFLYKPDCSGSVINAAIEKDSGAMYGDVYFYGDTIRTDTVACRDVLAVSRQMQFYHTEIDSSAGIDHINLTGSPYKVVIIEGQRVYAQAVMPKNKVGYSISSSGKVYSLNPFLRNKQVVTTDRLPKEQIQRIHNTARGMEKVTSYSRIKLKQYSDNGLYYIAEQDSLVWGIWMIGDLVPPKGDISKLN